MIILGGWHRQFPVDANDLKPPEKDVIDAVLSFGACAEAFALSERSWRAASPEKEEATASFQKLIAECDWIFQRKLDAHLWNEGRVSEAVRRALPDLTKDALDALAFMQNQALVFYPSESDPAQGWKDFYEVARSYNFLHDHLQGKFGPNYMLIQLPS